MADLKTISRDTQLKIATTLAPFKASMDDVVNYSKGQAARDIPAVITQTERLLTTRSRSVNHLDGGGDRGQRAFIKLLTTDKTRSLNRTDNQSHGNAKPTSLGTSSGGVLKDAVTGTGYASFLLTDISCALEEKLQIVETFGDSEVTYYFGRQPIMFNFSGVLMDSVDNNWFIEWLEMYSNVLRGSELARNYELVRLVLPNMTLEGTINRTSWSQNSSRDVDIPFQFGFLAKLITPTPIVAPNKPLTNDPVINWDKASGFLTQMDQNSIKFSSLHQKTQDLTSVIKDPLSSTSDYADSLINLGKSAAASANTMDINIEEPSTFANIGTSLSSMFTGLTSNLSGVRASLFSPVYGVLSSLTKLIKSVTGSIASVVNGFTNPVKNILRDIKNISNQAIGIVNLVNNSIKGITNIVANTDRELQSTIALLKKTAGVVSSSPKSISSSLRELYNAGKLPRTTKFLNTGYKPNLSGKGVIPNTKFALLNSGKKHTPESGAKL